MGRKFVYVIERINSRVASYRMAQDTVRLWQECGHDASLVRLGEEPNDADAYVYCKCVPQKRPCDGAMVAFHMHDFWDSIGETVESTAAKLNGAPIDVLVPCSAPYCERLEPIAREMGIRVAWCPESPVFSAPMSVSHPPPDGPFRVGFHGVGSTFRFLTGDPARGLERVAARFPLELVVLSNFPRVITEDALKDTMRMHRVRVRYVQWNLDTYAKEIACWDAAILPASHGNEYSFIKSCNRLREAIVHAVPVVAQRGNPDMEWFSQGGHNCALAGDSDEWFRVVRKVLRYRGTRNSYTKRSVKRLMSQYGTSAVMRRWESVFDM